MKTIITTVLALSLALNLVLAAVFMFRPAATTNAIIVATPPTPASSSTATPVAQTWSVLQTSNLTALKARLTTAGFPPDVVRAMIIAEIQRPFAARRAALSARYTPESFWKKSTMPWPDYMAELREISIDEHRALRAFFGSEADANDNALAELIHQRQLAGLPPDRAEAVNRVIEEYAEKNRALFGSYGAQNAAERAAQSALQREQRDAILAVLSPAEREIWELHNSNTANLLRYQLADLNPTEQEFLTLYRLEKAFTDQYGEQRLEWTAQQTQAWADAHQQLTAQIQTALGPARFADYERSSEDGYQSTTRLVSRLNLPAETADQIWSIRRDVLSRADAIRQDQSLTPVQQQQQLAALAAGAQAKITASLGPDGFSAYVNRPGYWLQALAPKSAPPKK